MISRSRISYPRRLLSLLLLLLLSLAIAISYLFLVLYHPDDTITTDDDGEFHSVINSTVDGEGAAAFKYLDSYAKTMSIKPLCGERAIFERSPSSSSVEATAALDPYTERRTDCQLHHYTARDLVNCLSQLRATSSSRINQQQRPFHVAFVGESVERHQYYSFIERIPDYDLRNVKMMTMESAGRRVMGTQQQNKHTDKTFSSRLLGLTVSFRWRARIDDQFIDTFRQWNEPPLFESTPNLIVMGTVLNYMAGVSDSGNNYSLFVRQLEQLKFIVVQLISNATDNSNGRRRIRIVWMQQSPIVYGSNTKVHRENTFFAKIHHYNAAVRRILKGTGVEIWDSAIPIAMEYVRSCAISERSDGYFWRNCFDSLHTGYVTLEHTSQMLFNAMCNNRILKS